MKLYESTQELLQDYTDDFYRLTNAMETHRGVTYHDGLNRDPLPFFPSGKCKPGGMYFFHVTQLPDYELYCGNVSYIRRVTLTPASKIYAEQGKFKTQEFILGKRKSFGDTTIKELLTPHSIFSQIQPPSLRFMPKEYITLQVCIEYVKKHAKELKYVPPEYCTYELCKLAIQNSPFVFGYIPNEYKTNEIYHFYEQGIDEYEQLFRDAKLDAQMESPDF